MSCPFKDKLASGAAQVPPDHPPISQHAPSQPPNTAKPPTQPASCPFLSKQGAQPSHSDASAGHTTKEPPSPPAVCPLGFGSSNKGPRLSPLHCIICKSLMYNCVVTECGHRFCAACISRTPDCPACGADVGTVSPDKDVQDLVDSFIEHHGGDSTIWNEGDERPTAPSTSAHSDKDDTAAFLLEVGLKALSGGNLDSAMDRLQQCRSMLQSQLSELPSCTPRDHNKSASTADTSGQPRDNDGDLAERKARLMSQLGAVCGCLGDCHRASGDLQHALKDYEQAATCLGASANEQIVEDKRKADQQEHANARLSIPIATVEDELQSNNGAPAACIVPKSPEAAHALTVTLNKIGEVHHLMGDVAEAARRYEQSLQLRRQRLHELIASSAASSLVSTHPSSNGVDGEKDGRYEREAPRSSNGTTTTTTTSTPEKHGVEHNGTVAQHRGVLETPKPTSPSSSSSSLSLLLSAWVDVAIGEVKVADALQSVGGDRVQTAGKHLMAAQKAVKNAEKLMALLCATGAAGGGGGGPEKERSVVSALERKLEAVKAHLSSAF